MGDSTGRGYCVTEFDIMRDRPIGRKEMQLMLSKLLATQYLPRAIRLSFLKGQLKE
jgi:hypothetical protein